MAQTPQAETIAAIATPQGRGGIGVVRVSGPLCLTIAQRLAKLKPNPRHATLCTLADLTGAAIDQGLLLYFPGPHSFTGEDTLEFQGHGGPVVMDAVLNAVLACGVRLAAPGEFSRRAFINGKLDLSAAEAIADLIDSQSSRAAKLALRTLQGALADAVNRIAAQLIEIRVFIEASLDFPDEELDPADTDDLTRRIQVLQQELVTVCAQTEQGRILREGITVVIAGRPNAGKSTLLNALAGKPSAIVTDIPGTTRDLIREDILIDGMPVHIVDTAGLRDGAQTVEQIGIDRALQEAGNADLILYLVDDTVGWSDHDTQIRKRLSATVPLITVFTKIDASGRTQSHDENTLALSVIAGQGMQPLLAAIKNHSGLESGAEGLFLARRRHVVALEEARQHMAIAEALCGRHAGLELVAEELRLAHKALGGITGEFTSEDLLGEIFTTFCIGK